MKGSDFEKQTQAFIQEAAEEDPEGVAKFIRQQKKRRMMVANDITSLTKTIKNRDVMIYGSNFDSLSKLPIYERVPSSTTVAASASTATAVANVPSTTATPATGSATAAASDSTAPAVASVPLITATPAAGSAAAAAPSSPRKDESQTSSAGNTAAVATAVSRQDGDQTSSPIPPATTLDDKDSKDAEDDNRKVGPE